MTNNNKVKEILSIWYALTYPRQGKLLQQLEDGRVVAKIRQRGIEGALDSSMDSLDCLLEQFRSYQGGAWRQ